YCFSWISRSRLIGGCLNRPAPSTRSTSVMAASASNASTTRVISRHDRPSNAQTLALVATQIWVTLYTEGPSTFDSFICYFESLNTAIAHFYDLFYGQTVQAHKALEAKRAEAIIANHQIAENF